MQSCIFCGQTREASIPGNMYSIQISRVVALLRVQISRDLECQKVTQGFSSNCQMNIGKFYVVDSLACAIYAQCISDLCCTALHAYCSCGRWRW